jgi:hypothetical protein
MKYVGQARPHTKEEGGFPPFRGRGRTFDAPARSFNSFVPPPKSSRPPVAWKPTSSYQKSTAAHPNGQQYTQTHKYAVLAIVIAATCSLPVAYEAYFLQSSGHYFFVFKNVHPSKTGTRWGVSEGEGPGKWGRVLAGRERRLRVSKTPVGNRVDDTWI